MKFGIRGRHIELTAAVLAHVERRADLHTAIDRAADRVERSVTRELERRRET